MRKTSHVFYCQQELWEQVRVVAASQDRSMAWVLEKAVSEYLKKWEAENPQIVTKGTKNDTE